MLKFAIYISNHGYGHATRMAALANEFIHFGIFIHIRSARPDFLFTELDHNYFKKDNVFCDVGAKHGKNLVPDLGVTNTALLDLHRDRLSIVDREVEFLRSEKIDLVIADIPWLVVEAASFAGIPVFAVSNFDWVFIYERMFAGDSSVKPLLNVIHSLYQRVNHAFRLPMSSPQSMASFRKIEKVGLLAIRKPSYIDIRVKYGLTAETPILTCTFGGEGEMEIDLDKVCAAFPGYVLSAQNVQANNHIRINQQDSFTDIIHGSDIMLTKPGYSSFAEAMQFGKVLIYQPRDNYPEEEILIRGIARYRYQVKLENFSLSKQQWSKIFIGIQHPRLQSNTINNCNTPIAALIIQRFMELKHHRTKLVSVFDTGSNNLNYSLCENGSDLPIHTAQISTGLGKGYKSDPRDRYHITLKRLNAYKKTVSDFMIYDHNINSVKQVIATGIHRKTDISNDLSKWFSKKWNVTYKTLSEKEEIDLVYFTAKDMIPARNSALIIDIGGFSTELIFCDALGKRSGISMPLGLLILLNAKNEGLNTINIINETLSKVQPFKPDITISIGLSSSYLANIVKKHKDFDPNKLHGASVSKKELQVLSHELINTSPTELNRLLVEPQFQDILQTSIEYNLLLLDKFHASEFTVCYYGISTGYFYGNSIKKHPRLKMI